MELLKATLEGIEDAEIRERCLTDKRGTYTERFIVTEAGSQVGFLVIDPIPQYEPFFIYEIFVVSKYRRDGLGLKLLNAAEQIARKRAYQQAQVTVKSLNPELPQQQLIGWYQRHGYRPLANAQAPDTYLKDLNTK